MRIINLSQPSATYTGNAWLVLGDWNTLDDVNTLVDTGRNPETIERLEAANTGVGKRRVEQIVLTHSHYDHAELVPALVARYRALVRAYSPTVPHCRPLRDKERLRLGDRTFEVVHVPVHSADSVCLVGVDCPVLFSGDTPLQSMDTHAYHDAAWVDALRRLLGFRPATIHPGHGEPLRNARRVLEHALVVAASRPSGAAND